MKILSLCYCPLIEKCVSNYVKSKIGGNLIYVAYTKNIELNMYNNKYIYKMCYRK